MTPTRLRSLVVATLLATASLAAGQSPAAPSSPQARTSPAFPSEARIGFVDFTRVALASRQGQALTAHMQGVRTKKEQEVELRGKEVAALETKLNDTSSVLNESARAQLRRQFERAQVDFQRFAQDARAEVQQVQRELEEAFLRKASPVIDAVAKERSLWAVFSVDTAGLLWRAEPLDLSDEIARRIDAAP